jgi:tetratricopeptide (TPR) repeat protein
MLRRFLEILFTKGNPLAAMQLKAVQLQERYGSWPALFYEELTEDNIKEARLNPHLHEAAALFRQIIDEGKESLARGQLMVTTYQLASLLHRQGNRREAMELYREVIKICRVSIKPTDTMEWALCRALFRLAEMTIRQDRNEGEALFAESMELGKKRHDAEIIKINQLAIQYFRL